MHGDEHDKSTALTAGRSISAWRAPSTSAVPWVNAVRDWPQAMHGIASWGKAVNVVASSAWPLAFANVASSQLEDSPASQFYVVSKSQLADWTRVGPIAESQISPWLLLGPTTAHRGQGTAVHTVFSPVNWFDAASLEERHETIVARVESELFVLLSRLPEALRAGTSRNFARVLHFMNDDPESSVVSIESLRKSFELLAQALPQLAPTFGVTEKGYFYLQWHRKPHDLVGITITADGEAIWTSSQHDPLRRYRRMLEAGRRSIGQMVEVLRAIAPWMFEDANAAIGRRAAL